MREASQVEPKPTVVVTRSGPGGLVLALGHLRLDLLQLPVHAVGGAEELLADLGEDEAAGVADEELQAEVVLEGRDLAADTADWLMPSFSAAWVKLPDSAAVWKMRSLSQSSIYSAASASSWAARNFSASRAAMQPMPAAVTAWRKMSSVTSPAAIDAGDVGLGRAGLDLEVAAGLHVELAGEDRGRGRVADGDEDAVDVELAWSRRSRTSRRTTPLTEGGMSVPVTSASSVFQRTSILGWLNSRFCRMRSARNSPRRWTTVTLLAKLVRNSASSTAVLPPPTTTTSLSR